MDWLNKQIQKITTENVEQLILTNVEKVKTHFRENKNIYISAVVGGAVVLIFKKDKPVVTVINNFTFKRG